MRRTRVDIERAYHRFCLERLAGKSIEESASLTAVSRATAYRFERRRAGTVEVSDRRPERVVASSSRVKVAGKQERQLVELWLDGKSYTDIGATMGVTRQGAEAALGRLWRSNRWHAILAGLEALAPPRESVVRRCPQCGWVCSFKKCPRCSSPRRPVETVLPSTGLS